MRYWDWLSDCQRTTLQVALKCDLNVYFYVWPNRDHSALAPPSPMAAVIARALPKPAAGVALATTTTAADVAAYIDELPVAGRSYINGGTGSSPVQYNATESSRKYSGRDSLGMDERTAASWRGPVLEAAPRGSGAGRQEHVRFEEEGWQEGEEEESEEESRAPGGREGSCWSGLRAMFVPRHRCCSGGKAEKQRRSSSMLSTQPREGRQSEASAFSSFPGGSSMGGNSAHTSFPRGNSQQFVWYDNPVAAGGEDLRQPHPVSQPESENAPWSRQLEQQEQQQPRLGASVIGGRRSAAGGAFQQPQQQQRQPSPPGIAASAHAQPFQASKVTTVMAKAAAAAAARSVGYNGQGYDGPPPPPLLIPAVNQQGSHDGGSFREEPEELSMNRISVASWGSNPPTAVTSEAASEERHPLSGRVTTQAADAPTSRSPLHGGRRTTAALSRMMRDLVGPSGGQFPPTAGSGSADGSGGLSGGHYPPNTGSGGGSSGGGGGRAIEEKGWGFHPVSASAQKPSVVFSTIMAPGPRAPAAAPLGPSKAPSPSGLPQYPQGGADAAVGQQLELQQFGSSDSPPVAAAIDLQHYNNASRQVREEYMEKERSLGQPEYDEREERIFEEQGRVYEEEEGREGLEHAEEEEEEGGMDIAAETADGKGELATGRVDAWLRGSNLGSVAGSELGSGSCPVEPVSTSLHQAAGSPAPVAFPSPQASRQAEAAAGREAAVATEGQSYGFREMSQHPDVQELSQMMARVQQQLDGLRTGGDDFPLSPGPGLAKSASHLGYAARDDGDDGFALRSASAAVVRPAGRRTEAMIGEVHELRASVQSVQRRLDQMQARRQVSVATMEAAISSLQAQREQRQISRSTNGYWTPSAAGSPAGSVTGAAGTTPWLAGPRGVPTSGLSIHMKPSQVAPPIIASEAWFKQQQQQQRSVRELPEGSLLSLPSVPHSHVPSVSSVRTPSISASYRPSIG